MDFFIILILVAICMWILNFILGMNQIKRFNNGFIEMRKKGKVAIGRKKGRFSPGAIILFRIEEDGLILEGMKMYGSSVIANLREFDDFNNSNLLQISDQAVSTYPKSVRKAILDAKYNFEFYLKKEEIND